MLFSTNREEIRQVYVAAWQKHLNQLPIEPLEQELITVIQQHPEYQSILTENTDLDKTYLPESGEVNPFLHMGLHLGLREQVQTNRPTGIADLYNTLCQKTGDPHTAEHQMMDCLAQALWEAQRNNTPPDEISYLDSLKALL